MIVSEQVESSVTQADGSIKAAFKYTASDGRVVRKVSVIAQDESDLSVKLAEYSDYSLLDLQRFDASEALAAGIKSAHGLATGAQVIQEWLRAGFNADEHYQAYEIMKDIAPSVLALGLSDDEYSALLGVSLDDVAATRAYWEYLEANKDVIIAYTAIAGVV